MNTNRFIPQLMILASLGGLFPTNLLAQIGILQNNELKAIPTDTTVRPRAIQGGGVHVVETEDGIAAYSDELGKWDRVVVAPRDDGKPRLTHATVGLGGIATVVVNDELFGFSSQWGHWLRHKFPHEYRGKVTPVVGDGVAAVTIGDELFGINGKSRHWSRVTIPAEFRGKVHPIVGIKKVHAEMGNKIIVLSSTTGEWTSPDESNAAVPDELAAPGSPRRDTAQSHSSSPSQGASELTSEIRQHEARAALVAAKVRKLTGEQGQENALTIEARRELDQELDAALDLRFRREELQVREWQSRLSRLEQMIGQRKAQRTAIIERRANELIEGETLKWDRSDPSSEVPKVESAGTNPRQLPDFETAEPSSAPTYSREQMLRSQPDLSTDESVPTQKNLDFISAFNAAKLRLTEANTKLVRIQKLFKKGYTNDSAVTIAQHECELAQRNWQLMQDRFKPMYEDLQLQLESAEIDVKQAQHEYDYKTRLVKDKVISSAELVPSEGKLRQAELARGRLKIRINLFAKASQALSSTEESNPPANDP